MIDSDSNFAAALCILAYSEALGRFRAASIGDGSNAAARQAFEYFLNHMGYTSAEANSIYSDLRNGMAPPGAITEYANPILVGLGIAGRLPFTLRGYSLFRSNCGILVLALNGCILPPTLQGIVV